MNPFQSPCNMGLRLCLAGHKPTGVMPLECKSKMVNRQHWFTLDPQQLRLPMSPTLPRYSKLWCMPSASSRQRNNRAFLVRTHGSQPPHTLAIQIIPRFFFYVSYWNNSIGLTKFLQLFSLHNRIHRLLGISLAWAGGDKSKPHVSG